MKPIHVLTIEFAVKRAFNEAIGDQWHSNDFSYPFYRFRFQDLMNFAADLHERVRATLL